MKTIIVSLFILFIGSIEMTFASQSTDLLEKDINELLDHKSKSWVSKQGYKRLSAVISTDLLPRFSPLIGLGLGFDVESLENVRNIRFNLYKELGNSLIPYMAQCSIEVRTNDENVYRNSTASFLVDIQSCELTNLNSGKKELIFKPMNNSILNLE